MKDRFDSLRFWQRPSDPPRDGGFSLTGARRWFAVGALVVLVAAAGALWLWPAPAPETASVPFSTVSTAIEAGNVGKVVVSEGVYRRERPGSHREGIAGRMGRLLDCRVRRASTAGGYTAFLRGAGLSLGVSSRADKS